MKSSLQIRRLTAKALPFAEGLESEAGGNHTVADWKRLIALNPRGCFVAGWDGEPAGTLTTTIYGEELAWIGMVLVRPEFKRHGIAKELMKHALAFLKEEKITCIKLDATAQAQRLYKPLGFKPEARLHRWEREGSPEELREIVHRDLFLREFERGDLVKIRELDQKFFGADRGRLLKALLADSVRASVWDLYSDIESYGMLRPGADADYVGPVVSTSEHHAHMIVRDLMRRSKKDRIIWDIPDDNEHATVIAESLGFESVQSFTRMYKGRNKCRSITDSIYGISDPATG